MALPPSFRWPLALRLLGSTSTALARWGAGIVAPRACAACDAPLPHAAVFCAVCAAAVERLPPGQEPLAFGLYGGPLALALKRFKYDERPDLQEQLASLLLRACEGLPPDGVVVAPVPLHTQRLRERGYNQAALLGSSLARTLGARWCPRLLVRLRPTEQQAKLEREARGRNVAGAFALRNPAGAQGLRVLLVDDVCTSGATLDACRAVLLAAGALEVRACVVARALREPPLR